MQDKNTFLEWIPGGYFNIKNAFIEKASDSLTYYLDNGNNVYHLNDKETVIGKNINGVFYTLFDISEISRILETTDYTTIETILNKDTHVRFKINEIIKYKNKLTNLKIKKQEIEFEEFKYNIEVKVIVDNGEDYYELKGTESEIRRIFDGIIYNEQFRKKELVKFNNTLIKEFKKYVESGIETLLQKIKLTYNIDLFNTIS